MALENIGLRRNLLTLTKPSGPNGPTIAIGSDIVEAIAIAMINAEFNTQLRDRVKASIEGIGDDRNVVANKDDLIPGNVATFVNIGVAKKKIVSRNTDPNWKRKQFAVKAHATNSNECRLHLDTPEGSHYWELEPSEVIQISCTDETEIWVLGLTAGDDLSVWPFGFGTPAPADIP